MIMIIVITPGGGPEGTAQLLVRVSITQVICHNVSVKQVKHINSQLPHF